MGNRKDVKKALKHMNKAISIITNIKLDTITLDNSNDERMYCTKRDLNNSICSLNIISKKLQEK